MSSAPYWIPAGRAAAAGTMLLPVLFVAMLSLSHRGRLHEHLRVTPVLRVALVLHGLYFSCLPVLYEAGLDHSAAGSLVPELGLVPDKPQNIFWQMACLSAELFFVAAVLFFAMASQESVPRWTLLPVLAQVGYNLKNAVIWLVLWESFSPSGTRMASTMEADAAFISSVTLVYLWHYLGSPATARAKSA